MQEATVCGVFVLCVALSCLQPFKETSFTSLTDSRFIFRKFYFFLSQVTKISKNFSSVVSFLYSSEIISLEKNIFLKKIKQKRWEEIEFPPLQLG